MHYIKLHKNGLDMNVESAVLGDRFNGSDVSSQAVLLKLSAGDVITLRLNEGPVYSDENYQTSLVGFLYEPVNVVKVAWSLGYVGGSNVGPANVNFDSVLLNEGGAYNDSLGTVEIVLPGKYYLKISTACGDSANKLKIAVLRNGVQLFNVIEKTNTRTNLYNVRSQVMLSDS